MNSDLQAEIVEKVRQHIGIQLDIISHKFDDDWLYIVVKTMIKGMRTSDYASLMSKVEKDLKSQGYTNNVLLVPLLED